jgi:hypothetical protein
MSHRSRIPFWTPPLAQAFRLSLRPMLAFQLFSFSGLLAFLVAIAVTHRSWTRELEIKQLPFLLLLVVASVSGVFVGQLVALLRVRTFVAAFSVMGGTFFLSGLSLLLSDLEPSLRLSFVVFTFTFPTAFACGFLSLQHRWDLLASFWPAVGWIGAAIVCLEGEQRVEVWEQSKARVWTPVPLLFLLGFLVVFLVYLLSKQALRIELWQALSGSARRRILTKATVSALPRRNVMPMVALATLLTTTVALLAPYLWRTSSDKPPAESSDSEPSSRSSWNMNGLESMLQELLEAAKAAKPLFFLLLLLLVLYRPVKRALLLRHLVRPLVPTPPSERIDNLWVFVRIAAEDAGVVIAPSDSVEQILQRIATEGRATPAIAEAASIYARTRYGFTVTRGDVDTMKTSSLQAARDLRRGLSPWSRVRAAWRGLA